jgi:hypothetical protein
MVWNKNTIIAEITLHKLPGIGLLKKQLHIFIKTLDKGGG